MPLPDRDFDPTEAAVPWSLIREAGHEVVVATETGRRPRADPMMISGEGLDPWGFIPSVRRIKLIGMALRAGREARDLYASMEQDESFLSPARWGDLDASDFDGLILPGGHGPGVTQFLESEALQRLVADFFESGHGGGVEKPIGAICHGVVLAARATSPRTGLSVLHGRRTVALTWRQENLAWKLTRRFARFWDPHYYRTYSESSDEPEGYRGVEAEVTRALADETDFVDVPADAPDHRAKTDNRRRDSRHDSSPAWVVRDGNYVSARWPGDAYTFARDFVEMLNERETPA